MRINFVLIDLENIQPDNLSLLKGGPFKIKVFVGASQTKIPLEMARVIQAFGADAEYIQSEGGGNNALDFHIAYYIGRLAVEFPGSYFHIISKDTGFDPLIKHLKSQKIFCQRSESIVNLPLSTIPPSKPVKVSTVDLPLSTISPSKPIKVATSKPSKVSSAKPPKTHNAKQDPEKLDAIINDLVKRKKAKPSTLKTLRTTIRARFANQFSDDELESLLAQLTARGVIKVADGKVVYKLPV